MKLFVLFIFSFLIAPMILAHQPVFDMAPRWADGSGFQIRYQEEMKDKLELDGNRMSNPNNLKKERRTVWWEGVYTFQRAVRLTLKVPYRTIDERIMTNGVVQKRSEEGLGDIIFGVPLKKYFNKDRYTGNFSFTPSLHLPTGDTSGPIRLGRGTVDYGLSFSFNIENFFYYTLIDFFTRINTRGSDGVLLGNSYAFDWDVGIHPMHNNETNTGIFLILALNGRQQEKSELSNGRLDPNSGGGELELAPTFVFYRKNFMWRAQYHVPVVENLNGLQLVKTREIQAGIGFTF